MSGSSSPAMVYAGWSLALVALAVVLGFTGLSLPHRERRRDLASFATLLAGLAGLSSLLFLAAEMNAGLTLNRGYDGYTAWGRMVAPWAVLLTPFAALFLHKTARAFGSRVQEWAAHPAWIGSLLFGLVTAFALPGPWSWVLLAPVVLVPLLIGEALFLSPRAPEAAPVVTQPASLRPSQLSLGQVQLRLAKCPVCRDDVRDGARACTQCKTPHHAECFDFNGRCAIFGCTSFAAEPIKA